VDDSNLRENNRPKRIAVFVEHFPPFLGSDRSVFELAKRVAEKGVQVHFVATQPLRYLVGQRPDNWSYKNRWKQTPPSVHKNISCTYLYHGYRMERLWKRIFPLAYLITLLLFTVRAIREILRFNTEIVVSAHASPILGLVAFGSARLTRRPILMGCPDWMSAYAAGLVSAGMNTIGPIILQIVEFGLYRWSNRVFAVTEYLAKLVSDLGTPRDKITVIPNGVDIDVFTPDVDVSQIKSKYRLHDRCIVLFSGHLEEWAGVSLIQELARRLSKEAPGSNILLVGSGASMRDLLDTLVGMNLGHMVTMAGLQPFQMMPAFTVASDIALCIFPDTPVSHAASPLKLFEYLATGRAIVATKVSGTMEILDESHGLLVNPGDTSGICDAVIELIQKPELRKELGNLGRKLVEDHYSWTVLSDMFLDVCNSLISTK
jgi:glycosyltransferase involved in cell wall biosynthesis